MLEIRNINKSFGRNKVLSDINLKIYAGDFIQITGSNGSGKTTLMNIIAGLVLQDTGCIKYTKKDINTKISFITSNINSFYLRLSSYENLNFYGHINNISLSKIHETINIFDGIFEISKFLHKKMYEISDGQKKKILIARSFLNEPNIILCDEITNFLDEEARNSIIKFINERNSHKNLTTVWVSHENLYHSDLINVKRYKLSNSTLKKYE